VSVYKEYSADIHNSGVHLLNLINETWNQSRIEAGRYELNGGSGVAVHVVADCHHLLNCAPPARITSTRLFEQGNPRIWGDERATGRSCSPCCRTPSKFTRKAARSG